MRITLIIALLFILVRSTGQIPVEFFGGNERSTLDILFFRNFRNKDKSNSHWLFFNRNRAAVDYRMTSTAYLPSFGFTEAVSYNHPHLKGLAPVMVAQIFNTGLFPKAGIQYVYLKKDITLFSWIVSETLTDPNLDHFLLFRFTPVLNEHTKLFSQLETLSVFPTARTNIFNFTQRIRLGIQWQHFQAGLGTDLNQRGRKSFTNSSNTGLFLRYEF